ncbi:hypothetical protein Acid345_3723 [Candidatus Koribacter versatilis Ellin345]|uniref:N-acetyltransferase domain-containing protein n=1 Tax=Koribacter versatilis (strain Ellin345) TaxID=204669 RepID=Q1IK76_KORVE|nr:GNAT family N-acetyltransferase [Candidatus Koribacter versatilis]ABF42724.1 hypothetical protein Acid345_3723 [Candidatus Koribacter versatilis Ellin345]
MTIDEGETLIKTKTRTKVRIHRIEKRVGDSIAFLSYSVDDQNKMTIWHTEIPPSLQHVGIGGKLVEEAVQLASRESSRLRIVCPFAREHLGRHPEFTERYDIATQALIPDDKSLSGGVGVTRNVAQSERSFAKSLDVHS